MGTKAEAMQPNPPEPAGMINKREIKWGFEDLPETHLAQQGRWRRWATHAALFVTAGLATMFVPLVWSGRWETNGLFVVGSSRVEVPRSSQDAPNFPASAVMDQLAARNDTEQALRTAEAAAAEQKLALEQERKRGDTLRRDLASAREEIQARKAGDVSAKKVLASAAEQKLALQQERERNEVLAHQLTSAQVDITTLTARVSALTDERSEAEKAAQTAQASAAEQKLALEQERERGEALLREREVEVRRRANAAGASMRNPVASVTEMRQRGEVFARQLASARADIGRLTARVKELTDARAEAELALRTAQVSAAEQKRVAEQERERGEILARQLASAREDLGTLTARVTALTNERIEADKAVETAQAFKQERALLREPKVEARTRANAADGAATSGNIPLPRPRPKSYLPTRLFGD